jgi:hypothetical protein
MTGKWTGSTSFTRYDCGIASGSTFSTSAGLSRKSSLNCAYASSRSSNSANSTSGIASILSARASISGWEASSRRNTDTSTFCAHSPVINRTCRSTSSAPPRRNREMNTVEMAANVTSALRRRAVAVSRKK